MQSIDFHPTQAARWNNAALAERAGLDFQDSEPAVLLDLPEPELAPVLRARVLRTARQREEISSLRKHSPMGVEDDLGAGLMPFEGRRDEVGVVTAIFRGSKLIATLRFVPSGLKLTAAECVRGGVGEAEKLLKPGSWEVGRLIVAPDERSPELLQECLVLALQALMEEREVEHFYAIANPVMGRLWRRFGLRPVAPLRGESGRDFVLVAGPVTAVAKALDVPLEQGEPVAMNLARPRHNASVALAA